jgi:hypothetical protein
MNKKRIFLLDGAHTLELKESVGCYDYGHDMNIKFEENKAVPVVSLDMAPPTESKTMAAPGDDDPDPSDERCY